jgi:squalene cyclase
MSLHSTGGYATCEETRGWHFFEWFNASEVFGEIMIDYDYVECTSSALQGLCLFRHYYPFHRTDEVNGAIKRAAK